MLHSPCDVHDSILEINITVYCEMVDVGADQFRSYCEADHRLALCRKCSETTLRFKWISAQYSFS